ncbi:MAG: polysaccharide deacetylase family protein [Terriglobia bacterium]
MRRTAATATVLLALAAFIPGSGPGSAAPGLPERLSALAVLALSPAEAIEVQAIESNLEMLGVPFETTADVSSALRAPVVVLAGALTNTVLSPAEREQLYAYVEAGGVVLATHVHGNQFFPLFGLAEFASHRANFRLHFLASPRDAALRYLNRPEEQEIRLGDPERYQEVSWTTEYRLAGAEALGRYPNGAVAFARHYYGRGIAYCLGISFADSTLRPALGQTYEAERQWANVFAPSADALRLLLRALYESHVHPFVLIHPIPDGQETALLLSHDLDARESFRNAVVFAALEQRYGVTSTFFVTTKYFTDATDIGYYTPRNVAHLRTVHARGFDLGSHTVSHLKTFDRFPLGEPEVSFESYRPRETPTVIGEVKVSKELLERDIPGQRTVSFRAGELSHPPQLIRALEAAGYRVDSTRAAGNTLTNYPYRALRETHLGAPVTEIIEIPVTLDDSMGYLTADNVEEVVAAWRHIIEANGENNAVTCLLIHPTDTTYKLEAEERLLEAYRDQPVWIGDVSRFGLFARQRALVRLSVFAKRDQLLLRLNRARGELPAGLTLAVEAGPRRATVVVEDSEGQRIPFTTRESRWRDRVFLVLRP